MRLRFPCLLLLFAGWASAQAMSADSDQDAAVKNPPPAANGALAGDDVGNRGNANVGLHNQGYDNVGNGNRGKNNVGDDNQGDYNVGNGNQGKNNVGDDNQGDYNVGNHNQGNHNRGSYNQGDNNIGDHWRGNNHVSWKAVGFLAPLLLGTYVIVCALLGAAVWLLLRPRSASRPGPFQAGDGMRFESSLDLDQCANLLKNSTLRDDLFKTMFAPSGTLICQFTGNKFRLRQKRGYQNSYAPYFYGQLKKTEKGTEIEGRYRIHPFVRCFTTVWFSGVILIGSLSLMACLTRLIKGSHDHAQPTGAYLGILIPLGMLAFGIALAKFGMRLGKSEEKNMTELLQRLFPS